MIGSALSKTLVERGYRVHILTRDASRHPHQGTVAYYTWDVKKGIMEEEAIRDADYIIHLAGANVAEKRWTRKRKKEIVESRVASGKLLVHILQSVPNKVQALISSSGIGVYGPDPRIPNPEPFTETHPPAAGYLADVVRQWEGAVAPVTMLNKRLVIFRTGLVLSKESGAYPEFGKTIPFGLATILGTGRQMISWIHIDDLVRLYIEAIEKESYSGIYNAVTPSPVSNRELILSIASKKNKFFIPLRVPSVLLKVVLGELSIEVLKSAAVDASRLKQNGFRFLFPDIGSAIQQLEAS